MSRAEETKKVKQLEYGAITEETTKSGQYSTLTKLERMRRRDLIRTSVSIETDHSTSDQDFQ